VVGVAVGIAAAWIDLGVIRLESSHSKGPGFGTGNRADRGLSDFRVVT